MQRKIALYAPQPQSGKTTVATYLGHLLRGGVYSFATPIRRMCLPLLVHHFGVPMDEASNYLWSDKSARIPKVGLTGRQLLIHVGDGLRSVDENFWIKSISQGLDACDSMGFNVIIDDLRRPNEYQYLRERGFEMWRVVGPVQSISYREGLMEGLLENERWDKYLINDGSIMDLKAQAAAALND